MFRTRDSQASLRSLLFLENSRVNRVSMVRTPSYFDIFLVLVHVNFLGNATPNAYSYWSKSYLSILVQPNVGYRYIAATGCN
jgi:hypothetical protein